MVLNTTLRLCRTKIDLKCMNTKILEKTVHFFNMDLADISLRKHILRYWKQQFAHVLLHIRSEKSCKLPATHLFNLQPATLLKKRQRDIGICIFCEFVEISWEHLHYEKPHNKEECCDK